ncbi:hypothetical protein IU483_17850 [Streptomyces gardneri]|nr:hypothetical protein [Streptomyces gardneri]
MKDNQTRRSVSRWPLLLLTPPAFVAIWSGWVGLGELTGFGPVELLPGIVDGFTINTAITLPIGMEAYASYALYVWLSGRLRTEGTRAFAKWSAIGGLLLGGVGQVAYHLMQAAHIQAAPWPVTVLVACLPVACLGMGVALGHMITRDAETDETATDEVDAAADLAAEIERLRAALADRAAETATAAAAAAPEPEPEPEPVSGIDHVIDAGSKAIESPRRPVTKRDPVAVLTAQQLAAAEVPVPDIANKLGVSTRTVRRYLTVEVEETTTEQPQQRPQLVAVRDDEREIDSVIDAETEPVEEVVNG